MAKDCDDCKYKFTGSMSTPCQECLRAGPAHSYWEPRPVPGPVIRPDDKPGGSTPSQYGLPDGATDLQDLIEYRKMNFAQGNIFKATYRTGNCSHSDELREARKVLWFAQREVDRLERESGE